MLILPNTSDQCSSHPVTSMLLGEYVGGEGAQRSDKSHNGHFTDPSVVKQDGVHSIKSDTATGHRMKWVGKGWVATS